MKKFLIAVALVGVLVVIAVAAGILDPRALRQRLPDSDTLSDIKTRAQQGKAKLEAEAARIAATRPSASEQQMAEHCRQNLRRIESAKRAIASRTGVAVGAVSWDAVVKELGGAMPKCLKGGAYSLGSLEHLPTCSIGANGTPDPGDDHQIRSF